MKKVITRFPSLPSTMLRRVCVSVFLSGVLFLTGNGWSQVKIEDPVYGFSLNLPDGFVEDPVTKQQYPKFICAYVIYDHVKATRDLVFTIEPLGGTIANERLNPKDIPQGIQVNLFTLKWKNYTVDAFEYIAHNQIQYVVSYGVQIPLRREAIQLNLAGPAEKKAELKIMLQQILDSLEGESNWSMADNSNLSLVGIKKLKEPPFKYYVHILLVVGIAVAVVIWALLWKLSRVTSGWVIMLIAFFIYAIGFNLGKNETFTHEISLIAGISKLTGSVGFIMGICALFGKKKARKVKPQDPSENS